MVIRYLGDGIYKGLSSDGPSLPTTAIIGALFIETNTRKQYIYEGGGVWAQTVPTTIAALTGDVNISAPTNDQLLRYDFATSRWKNATVTTGGGGASEGAPYNWLIYKSGANYKAKNGYLGTVPTGAISGSFITVWDYMRTHFTDTVAPAEETNMGGLVQFAKGNYVIPSTLTVDNTWGLGNRGPTIQGQAPRSTVLDFQPAGPIRDAFYIKGGIAGTSLRNLDIKLTDNVTNGIYIDGDATTGGNAEGHLYENLFISAYTRTGTNQLAGQHGIFMTSGGSPTAETVTHNSAFRRIHLRFLDTGIETETTDFPSGGGAAADTMNTSFLTFDDIFSWYCVKGINVGDWNIEHYINNMIFQDGTNSRADYGVRLGKYGYHHTVNNVLSDGMTRYNSGTLLVEGACTFCRGTNISNSSNNTVMDLSGNDTNEWTNVKSLNVPNLGGRMRVSRWSPWAAMDATQSLGHEGAFAGGFTRIGASAAITPAFYDTAGFAAFESYGCQFMTPATQYSQAGMRSTTKVTTRRGHPRFTARFVLNTIGNIRFYIGLTTSAASPPTGTPATADAYIANTSCIGVAIKGADSGPTVQTNFSIFHNDNSGPCQFEPAVSDYPTNAKPIDITTTRWTFGPPYSIPVTPADKSEGHEVWIYGFQAINTPPSSFPVWYVSLDRAVPQQFTADIPNLDEELYAFVCMETTQSPAAAKRFNLHSMKLESTR